MAIHESGTACQIREQLGDIELINNKERKLSNDRGILEVILRLNIYLDELVISMA